MIFSADIFVIDNKFIFHLLYRKILIFATDSYLYRIVNYIDQQR